MIVRPTPGKIQTERMQSQSPPTRRRANSTSATLAPKQAQTTSPPLPPQSPFLQRFAAQQPKPSNRVPTTPTNADGPSDTLTRSGSGSGSGKRKLFRLKRPSSSSSSEPRSATRGRSYQMLGHHYGLTLGAMSMSVLDPPAPPPPRPPRNPARSNLAPRPSSSGGPAHKAPRLHAAVDERKPKAFGDSAADWEFPLPRGSEFPLQRKKSKSRKFDPSRITQDESAKSDVQFSTVDRTILEELRQKIRAREEQFVTRSGRKYHAFSPADVPYPRSYDRQMVDLDVWDDLWQLQLGGSITMHVFDTPPARVLDLGCGTGTWILNAAREWKDSYFVGLDVVPLHPDLLQVGCFDLAARITWVQGNFLESLPFPNEEFDYVRLTRVGRGVPEDKWDALFEEITRVMKPGGAFEMWEEDLHFPGHRGGESVHIVESPGPMHPPTPPHTDSSHSSEQERLHHPTSFALRSQRSSLAFSYSFDDVTRVNRPMFEDTQRPIHASQSPTNGAQTSMLFRSLDRPPMNPHDHSLLEIIYNEMHAARFINLEPVSMIANLLPLHFRDVRAPPPIVVTFPPLPVPPVFDDRSDGSPVTTRRNVFDDPFVEEPLQVESPTEFGTFRFSQSPVLHARDMVDGTPYVGIDTARYSGVSPSAFRRKTLPSTTEQAAHLKQRSDSLPMSSDTPISLAKLQGHIAAGRNPLPNKTINFDPRTLNLLLTLRVNEVLGCAEPMWDWVVDFQENVARGGEKAGSSSVSEHIALRPRRRRRHPQEDALMSLTRLDFDALLRRFELDMKARMYLAPALEDRLGWPAYPVTPTEELETFEAMCAAWAGYEHRQAGATIRGSAFFRSKRSPSPPPFPTPRHSTTSDEGEATVRGRRGLPTAHHASHAPGQTHIPADPIRPAFDGLSRRQSAPEKPVSHLSRPSTDTSSSSLLSEPEQEHPPSSRTGRIFVAWKAAS
ncbi:hypothetical protein BD311DRAFT_819838 [Dichomitus squalens]|uniref:Methyltransferase domain-containing protein n=1 Tax=Dichomitus squalens TaxID=114155 RepID=A0A4Q9MB83_9APHY|nr:hypothetical protein BD311DRAFT_819838 [Dichomitus squalens]